MTCHTKRNRIKSVEKIMVSKVEKQVKSLPIRESITRRILVSRDRGFRPMKAWGECPAPVTSVSTHHQHD